MRREVSVIIPTFNRAPYLQALIERLLAQTMSPDHMIVVDDNSTDATAQLVQDLQHRHRAIHYFKNEGVFQRAAKQTGLSHVTQGYVGFLDDDVIIDDSSFFATLHSHLRSNVVIQAKVILENMGKKNEPHETWIDRLAVRPYPVLELPGVNYNTGSRVRRFCPLIETGNFWPIEFRDFFLDKNLINDGYGEGNAASVKLHRAGIPVLFVPELVIRHPGAPTGGSNRFHKQPMLVGFTEFHEGYFTNMIYLHARYYPGWIWLWLPYYVGKAVVALLINRQGSRWYHYALKPIGRSLYRNWIRREYA